MAAGVTERLWEVSDLVTGSRGAGARKSGVIERSEITSLMMVSALHFGQVYRVIALHAIASQFNESRTQIITEMDKAIPVGAVFQLGDAFEWSPY
jgi:hypothetical protein